MFLSILVPVYNKQQYLPECVESVLTQSETDFELVLTDDGSNDDSSSMCDGYALSDERVIAIHKPNQRLMMTRRCGFKAARGKIWLCVDSDDYLPGKDVLTQIRNIQTKYNCDIVQYEQLLYDSDHDQIVQNHLFELPDGYYFKNINEYRELFCRKGINSVCSRAIRGSIVDVDTDYSIWQSAICRGEDIFQTLPIIDNANRVAYIKRPLYVYRWNAENISNNPRIEFYSAYREIYTRRDTYMEKWNIEKGIVLNIHKGEAHHTAKLLTELWKRAKTSQERKAWKNYVRGLDGDDFTKRMLYYSKTIGSSLSDSITLWLALHGLTDLLVMFINIQKIKWMITGKKRPTEFY